ncbi:MAG: NEL-type E3 ubiquitin ligase domain-containing protein, partial [Pseudomonas fluorescens]
GRDTGTIDEVEVHLAYMTDLAERLDLPWQSQGMLFRNIAGVTQKMIEDAYQRVLALEEGELLAQRILEQPFWESYLEETFSKEYNDLQNDLKDADEATQFNAMKKLSRTLTQQAIDRAKLQRVEVPFTVMP